MSTPVSNPPGRASITRRVGTAERFAAAMAARLTQQPELGRFTSRRTDDPAIALVDAWAGVLDVLTFYTERLANESYLRTALDPRSLNELGATVGYLPGRGRASATVLAFTLEDAIGSPSLVPLPAGTKVASLPGPGEMPQTYETTGQLDARPGWNAIQARARVAQQLRAGATSAYVEGLRTDLTVGDAILVVGSEREGSVTSQRWAHRRLAAVQLMPELAATRLAWVDPLGTPSSGSGRRSVEQVPDARDLRLFVLRRQAGIFGAAAPDYCLINVSAGGGKPDPVRSSAAPAPMGRAVPNSAVPGSVVPGSVVPGSVVSGSATKVVTVGGCVGPDWPGFAVSVAGQPDNTVDLDASYPAAVVGSWAVLTRTGATACYRITGTAEEARTQFTLNTRVTRLTLDGPSVTGLFGAQVRQTSAWVGAEPLPLATVPVEIPVQGIEIELAGPAPTIDAGRMVVVRGPRPMLRVGEGVRDLVLTQPSQPAVALHPGDVLELTGPTVHHLDDTTTFPTAAGSVTAPAGALETLPVLAEATVFSEVATVAAPTPDEPAVDHLTLAAALSGCYDRRAVRILANVAPATHGETQTQILGSGDAAVPYQRFRLTQIPLTYVVSSQGTPASTLAVRVDGRLWREVPQLYGAGPTAEVFTTQADDEGRITVRFGDGLTGARLPTGTNNVIATYRIGIGVAGRVAADQLSLPMTRPLGLRSVTNPLASGLAADPESEVEVRANAPRTALTLDRVVSLADVEDFARAVPGIGQACATWLWTGRSRIIHLTVVGTGGQTVDAQAIADLKTALLAAGDARLPLVIGAAELVPVQVGVSVVVDPAYDTASVLDLVRTSLQASLFVDVRTIAQPLTTGDIILATHAVPGVVAVTIAAPADDVRAAGARMLDGQPQPAQLVVLAAGGLIVTEAAL